MCQTTVSLFPSFFLRPCTFLKVVYWSSNLNLEHMIHDAHHQEEVDSPAEDTILFCTIEIINMQCRNNQHPTSLYLISSSIVIKHSFTFLTLLVGEVDCACTFSSQTVISLWKGVWRSKLFLVHYELSENFKKKQVLLL